MVYSSYIEESKSYHRYSSKQQKAPTPKCVCFYNGTANKDDRMILSLADAFDADTEPDIEVKVTMININYGHNRELLESCRPLNEYSWFVDRVRVNRKENGKLEKAISAAIEALPDDALIKPFLMANKAEVTRMCITEYDEERTYAEMREEAIEEGLAQGMAQGMEKGMAQGMAQGMEKGMAQGMAQGMEKGMAQGMEKGRAEGMLGAFIGLVKKGMLTLSQAAAELGMQPAEFAEKAGLPD